MTATLALGATAAEYLESKIKKLQGPILVLGASGFVGANLLRTTGASS